MSQLVMVFSDQPATAVVLGITGVAEAVSLNALA